MRNILLPAFFLLCSARRFWRQMRPVRKLLPLRLCLLRLAGN